MRYQRGGKGKEELSPRERGKRGYLRKRRNADKAALLFFFSKKKRKP